MEIILPSDDIVSLPAGTTVNIGARQDGGAVNVVVRFSVMYKGVVEAVKASVATTIAHV